MFCIPNDWVNCDWIIRRFLFRKSGFAGEASAIPVVAMTNTTSSGRLIMQIRVARPTDKLTEVVTSYHDGMCLPVIAHFENHAG